ncbi:PIN domain-containing protein, partial [Devosia sp.]|uniref:PIN domain-containing protein n=1 Tax=Devosia sp. TaxID=1871048 RepID=UPI001ACCEDE9
AARRFMSARTADDPAFVSVVVLAELAWVLERAYGFDGDAIHEVFDWVLESANIAIERPELAERAVAQAKAARAGIADCLIAAISADAGAASTVTFDQPAAKRIPGMELLK